MEEYVKISLDRYNDFLDDNRKANLLYEIKKNLTNLIDTDDFDTNDYICTEIFKMYERLCNEI
jgi:hypothetical protein